MKHIADELLKDAEALETLIAECPICGKVECTCDDDYMNYKDNQD